MGEISTFGLELFSSSQIFYKGRARFINLPATDGGHTFLPHHENVIIALVPGTTKIVTETFSTECGDRECQRQQCGTDNSPESHPSTLRICRHENGT